MKKIISLISIFALCADSFAQLQVNTNGNVSVGILSNGNYSLRVKGETELYNLYMTGAQNQMYLYNTGTLSTSDKRKGIYMISHLDNNDTYGLLHIPYHNGN